MEASTTNLSQDEELQITIAATGDYEELTEPTSEGFDFRQSGRRTQVTLSGGEMMRVEQFQYVATPRRPGQWRIAPVELKAGGQVVAKSNALEVVVAGDDASAQPAESPDAATNPQRFVGQAFFVKPSISVLQPFVGQAFVVTWELYWTRTMHVAGVRETQGPRYGSLDVEDLLGAQERQGEAVTFARHPYMRQVTRQVMLVAGQAGPARIDGPGYRIEAGDIFDTRGVKVAAPPLLVDVRPIPTAGRPVGFALANVGRMSLQGRLTASGKQGEATSAATGERLLLVYTVSGEGNLLGLQAIKPPVVEGMAVESVAGRADAEVKRTLAGMEGKRSWQYVVSFARPGKYTVPALEWSVFEPDVEQFTTSRAGPWTLDVVGPASDVAVRPDGVGTPAAATAAPAATRLRPIASDAQLIETTLVPWTRRGWFWSLVLLPWLGAASFEVARWQGRRRTRSAPRRKAADALKAARSALGVAATLSADRGYVALRRVVAEYLELRASVKLEGTTDAALARQLVAAGATEADVLALAVELQHLEFARFAPGGQRHVDLAETAARLSDIVGRIDAALPLMAKPTGRSPAKGGLAAALLIALAVPAGERRAAAATLDQTFADANRAYVAGRWQQARVGYETILRHGVPSSSVHYNLANTLVHEGKLGVAVGHYRRALRLRPSEALAADVHANLAAVRSELTDRARRKHSILHVFDESPELSTAVANAAPEPLLGSVALVGGWAALALYIVRRRGGRSAWVTLTGAVPHGLALGWIALVMAVETTHRHAVVVADDAMLSACTGVGEPIGLPEGLELRWLGERADGRVDVRLANGRAGCVDAATVQSIP
jgi:tetratricopeptide (TPR) repeat protein